ncbi:MAG: hypothetical protein ACOCX0_03665, partial [Bacteroidota bacterium]
AAGKEFPTSEGIGNFRVEMKWRCHFALTDSNFDPPPTPHVREVQAVNQPSPKPYYLSNQNASQSRPNLITLLQSQSDIVLGKS